MPQPTLILPRPRLAEIRALARHSYPEECCGVLLGDRGSPGAPLRIVELVPTRNAEDADRRRQGYRIAPSELITADRRARTRGLEIVGFYHSHPDRPAVPSPRDRRDAWPDASYLIVGVQHDTDGAARSWRLAVDRLRLVEERLLIGAEPSSPPSPRRSAGGPA